MAKGCYKKIAIRGIACAVPNEKKAANYWYNVFGQEAVDKFVKMTGVERVCQSIEEQTASDLAFIAAQALLKHKNIEYSYDIWPPILLHPGSNLMASGRGYCYIRPKIFCHPSAVLVTSGH